MAIAERTVGSVSLQCGYIIAGIMSAMVIALTRIADKAARLKSLGATDVVNSSNVSEWQEEPAILREARVSMTSSRY
jgi:D-arabinose 1-dehydrogenase-like Zn-dependent alcohol dehydrogenase